MSYLAKLSAIVARWVPCGNPDLIQLIDFDACEAMLDAELEAAAVRVDAVVEENTATANVVEPITVRAEIIDPIVEPASSSMTFMPAGEIKPLPVSVWGSPLPKAYAVSTDNLCVYIDTHDLPCAGDTPQQHTESPDSNPTPRRGNKAKQRREQARREREEQLLSRGADNSQRPDDRNPKKALKALARQSGLKRLDLNDLMIRSVEIG